MLSRTPSFLPFALLSILLSFCKEHIVLWTELTSDFAYQGQDISELCFYNGPSHYRTAIQPGFNGLLPWYAFLVLECG